MFLNWTHLHYTDKFPMVKKKRSNYQCRGINSKREEEWEPAFCCTQ